MSDVTFGVGIVATICALIALCSFCSLAIRVMRNTDHDGEGDHW